jgi:hypothetical protein
MNYHIDLELELNFFDIAIVVTTVENMNMTFMLVKTISTMCKKR